MHVSTIWKKTGGHFINRPKCTLFNTRTISILSSVGYLTYETASMILPIFKKVDAIRNIVLLTWCAVVFNLTTYYCVSLFVSTFTSITTHQLFNQPNQTKHAYKWLINLNKVNSYWQLASYVRLICFIILLSWIAWLFLSNVRWTHDWPITSQTRNAGDNIPPFICWVFVIYTRCMGNRRCLLITHLSSTK